MYDWLRGVRIVLSLYVQLRHVAINECLHYSIKLISQTSFIAVSVCKTFIQLVCGQGFNILPDVFVVLEYINLVFGTLGTFAVIWFSEGYLSSLPSSCIAAEFISGMRQFFPFFDAAIFHESASRLLRQ